MIDEVVEEGGDVVVETRKVGLGEPGEDCLTGTVGSCVKRAAEKLVDIRFQTEMREAYNVVPFNL